MSKYIYIDGKIYVKEECFYEDFKASAAKVIDFDNFEDIIEVGDLVRCNISPCYKPIRTGVVENIDKRKTRPVACDNFDVNFEAIVEIWKYINNSFVKVCYKEFGKWVIV